jgi:ketopantoate reductase
LKVAVVGAGALGAVYGVLLARRSSAKVTFVVRPARASSREPLVIERVRGNVRETLEAPERATQVPSDADCVLVAVGTGDLEALEAPLATSAAPLVVLTPMLPEEHQLMRAAYGERVLAAMPSVVSYARADGVLRYWLPAQPTRIDEPRAGSFAAPLRALGKALSEAGFGVRFELDVHTANPATTVCFIAIAMAIAVAGSVPALTADDALLELVAEACREGRELGRHIGRPEPWAAFAPLLAGKVPLRLGFKALQRLSPEGLFYAEEHFGRKLYRQHVTTSQAMARLARQRGTPHAAIDALAERLTAIAPGG